MTRLLWSAVATLVLIAVGAPCFTFYLLIKEYWAEVDSLRQELLLCKLGSKDSLQKSEFPDHAPFLGSETSIFPPVPIPQRLTSSPPDEEVRIESPAVSDRSSEDTNATEVLANVSTLSKMALNDIPSVEPTFRQSTVSKASNAKEMENADEKIICLSEDYVVALERRSGDLTARIDACRKCLSPTHLKDSECGGGARWRDYRRKEKLIKKKIREEKRKRRKKEKKSKEQYVESTAKSVDVTPQGKPLSDISSIFGFRFENSQTQDSHQMRQNHRASTDFRRGFNQKIVRMDEALMQFTDTQSAFCKELRDNLGGSLGKRGQELEALSEQIAALVRTTTTQVAMIEKLTSDQVHAGQTSIEKNLANLQVLRESQVRSFQNFHKLVFLPAMVTLTSLLGEQASAVTNMGVDLITKVEMLQDFFLTFSTQQGDALKKLAEEVDMFASKHGNLIMRSRDHAKHLHLNTENFIRELQTRMNNVVKELVLVRLQSQSFVSINENTYHEVSASLNNTEDVVANLSGDLHSRIEKAKSEEGDFRNSFRQETDIINSRIQTGVSEVLMRNHAAISQVGESELDTRVFSDSGEAAWNEMYVNQETELRQEADMLANKLRSQTHHTQNILTGLQGTASTHEQVLEQQRMDFQGFVRKRQDALDTQCSSISDWALLMSSELRKRDEDLHRYLNEESRFSPVTVQGVTEYNEYLVSRLPDGTLLYDSFSSDKVSPSEESASNVTAQTTEMAPEHGKVHTSVNTTEDQISSSGNTINKTEGQISSSLTTINKTEDQISSSLTTILLSNSSRLNSSLIQGRSALNTSSLKETGRGSSPNEERRMEGPSRGDLTGLKKNHENASENGEALSNDIQIYTDDDVIHNKITHQSDQAVMKKGCHERTDPAQGDIKLRELPTTKKDKDDIEFKRLEDILLEAKKTIIKFQQDFQTGKTSINFNNSDNKIESRTHKPLPKEKDLNKSKITPPQGSPHQH